ncbi:variant surface glycoprotein [Trypanosoma brucei equiperdum]|uniref:Variant surface glycoprotein n=1 Tax=Trypanosoma brucei equiperdum TaxID=630700 RepID=A0A3L6L925_9TRYP|nr:variant surface glycoprotein [Trypanosoma brucei equiperdum]
MAQGKAAFLLILCVCSCWHLSSADTEAIKETAIREVCELSKTLKGTPFAITQRWKHIEALISTFERLLRRLELINLLCCEDEDSVSILKLYTQSQIASLEVLMKALTERGPNAAAFAAYAAGRLDEFVAVFTQSVGKTPRTNACVIADSGMRRWDQAAANGCEHNVVGNAAQNFLDLEVLLKTTLLTGGNQKGESKQCPLTKSDLSGYATVDDAPDRIKWAGGLLTVHKMYGWKEDGWSTNGRNVEFIKEAAEQFKEIKKILEKQLPNGLDSIDALNAFLKREEPDAMMKDAIKTHQGWEEEKDDKTIIEKIKEIFGIGEPCARIEFIETLIRTNVSARESGCTKQIDLFQLTTRQMEEVKERRLDQLRKTKTEAENYPRDMAKLSALKTNTNTKQGEHGECQFLCKRYKNAKAENKATDAAPNSPAAARKCRGKTENDCKDECKWEGNVCKNSDETSDYSRVCYSPLFPVLLLSLF